MEQFLSCESQRNLRLNLSWARTVLLDVSMFRVNPDKSMWSFFSCPRNLPDQCRTYENLLQLLEYLLGLRNGARPRKDTKLVQFSQFILQLFYSSVFKELCMLWGPVWDASKSWPTLCWEEKLPWGLSSVELKIETGSVLYPVRLVMQDSSSLIKYRCILLP